MKNIIKNIKILIKKTPWRKILDFIPIYHPDKPVEELKRTLSVNSIIKLASNENALGPSPRIAEAVSNQLHNINRYPDGACFYLRKALSEKHAIPEDHFVFGNGSDEIIFLAVLAFLERGSEVVIANPSFVIYRLASVVAGAKTRLVPLKEDHTYDLDAMFKAITSRTKIVFIANPDNPTGSYIAQKELNSFIDKVPKDVLIFIDEAYYEFAKGGDYPETLNLLTHKNRNVVITRTFSKAYALAGLRIGYGMAREEIATTLNKVREPFSVNCLAQAAAIAALKDDDHLNASVALVHEEKGKLYNSLSSLGIKYVPSRTNFVLIDTERNSKKISDYLLNKGILVREMSLWGFSGRIRVNLGLPEENIKFLEVFKEALACPDCV